MEGLFPIGLRGRQTSGHLGAAWREGGGGGGGGWGEPWTSGPGLRAEECEAPAMGARGLWSELGTQGGTCGGVDLKLILGKHT